MNCSKMFVGGCNDAAAVIHIRQVCLHKVDLAGIGMERSRNGISPLCVSPTDDQPCCTARFEHPRDGLAQPL
jgi:hypothetical protein